MSFVLKRDNPVWAVRVSLLPDATAAEGIIILINDVGCQVTVPSACLLASSPLVRSIFTCPDILPPAYSPPVISLPSVTGDVLQVVGELLVAGEAFSNKDIMKEVDTVFKMLKTEAWLFCAEIENISLEMSVNDTFHLDQYKIEVKLEEDVDATKHSNLAEDGENLTNSNNLLVLKNLRKNPVVNVKNIKFEGKKVQAVTEGDINKCNMCDEKFLCKTTLRRHLQIIHKKDKLSCKFCEKKFISSGSFMKHIRIFHNKTLFMCGVCKTLFDSLDLYSLHILNEGHEKEYNCLVCDDVFKSRHTLRRHIDRVHINKEFLCESCDRKFTRRDHLNNHIKVIHKKTKFLCRVCRKLFGSLELYSLHKHIACEAQEKDYACILCNGVFRSRNTLRRHTDRVHLNKEFPCKFCERKFTRNDHLSNHIRVVHKKTSFECPVCRKVLKQAGSCKTCTFPKHSEQ